MLPTGIRTQEAAMATSTFQLKAAVEQRLAARLLSRVMELLESSRSAAQDDEMLHAAHATRHHWGQVADPAHWARGEVLCSQVYVALGRAEPALHHGRRSLELAEEHRLSWFHIGEAHAAVARAAKLAGLDDHAAKHAALALKVAERLTEPDEKRILLGNIAAL
jgi:hypothetical protein